jgi:hypothetical protein
MVDLVNLASVSHHWECPPSVVLTSTL